MIPLYQYFLKFSCFDVQLPPVQNRPNSTEYFPLKDLKCRWIYTDNYKEKFGSISKDVTRGKKLSMSEYEFMTARVFVKYLRNFPFVYTENDNLNEQELNDLIDVEQDDKYRNIGKIVDMDNIYYKMFEEKCDLMHIDADRINIKLPLAKNVVKELIREFKVNINGHSIDRTEFFIRADDEILFDIPSKDLTANCQRRLFEYLFKLYRIYNRKNDSVEQFLNSSQFRTIIKKTKKLTRFPSQSIELIQKLCIQRFNDNIVHGIRHCIIPNDCGFDEHSKDNIIVHEDEDIIVVNKPSGMAVHFAKETQKYHAHSLVNFLLFHCDDLRKNIQKDSNLLKSSKLQNYGLLPGVIDELQLTISPGMIHRIDRQTSGLMVVGKTIFAMSNLLKQWRFHEFIEREYITLVHGAFDGNALRNQYDPKKGQQLQEEEDGEDDIYSPDVSYSTFYEEEEFQELYGEYYARIKLQNDKKHWQAGYVDTDYYKCENWIGPKMVNRHLPLSCFDVNEYKERKEGMKEKQKMNPYKIACSHFYKLQEYEVDGHAMTLLKCVLITGRTHQIRLQLQHLGMAVVGDRIYPRLNKEFDVMDELEPNDRRWRPRFDDEQYHGEDVRIEKELFCEGDCEGIDWFTGDHHALHAHTLKFEHPTTEQQLEYKVDLPPFFQNMIRTLETSKSS